MDPVTYPIIHLPVIGNPNQTEEFTVFFSVDAITWLLSAHQIDIFQQRDFKKADGTMDPIAAVEHSCKLLVAGISHMATISIEDMRKRVDISNLQDIAAAVNRAISKVSPQVPATTKPEQIQ